MHKIEMYDEHSTYSSLDFLKKLIQYFPFLITEDPEIRILSKEEQRQFTAVLPFLIRVLYL